MKRPDPTGPASHADTTARPAVPAAPASPISEAASGPGSQAALMASGAGTRALKRRIRDLEGKVARLEALLAAQQQEAIDRARRVAGYRQLVARLQEQSRGGAA